MKFTVRINEFKRLLEEARYVIWAESGIATLTKVKVDVVSENFAMMSGTDLGMSIVQRFEVIDGEIGSLLLPARQTRDFLKRHIGGTAAIETTTDQHILIKVGTFTLKVPNEDVRMFTRIEEMPKATHTISLKFLRQLVTRVERSCPARQLRTSIPYIKLESDSKRLRAVATDGRRIAVADAPGDWGHFSIQLHKQVLPVLQRRAGSIVQFAESEHECFFQTEGVLLQCRKPRTDTFPKYEKFLPVADSFKNTLRVASSDLKSAIVNIFGGMKPYKNMHREVFFDIDGSTVWLSTKCANGSALGSARVATEGNSNIKIKLNADYVLDFLSTVEGEIALQFNDASSLVRFSADDKYQYLMMPIRFTEPTAETSPSSGPPEKQAA
jgi:DNA polymerase III subunit beta